MAKQVKKKIEPKKISKTLNSKRFLMWFWIVVVAPVALLLLLVGLTVLGTFGKLPTFEDLENPKSNLATEVYSEDGEMIGSFFLQNRSYTTYEELSPNLVAALVATEDARFYTHSGIDFVSLARVGFKTVLLGQKQGGGSTITQQLAKNLYETRNEKQEAFRLFTSKLKEWITAVGLEYNYTKDEIIAMYLNTVEFGSNAYGIKSAARTFYNKLPEELSIEEAAMLVGVVNAPTRYSPRLNPDNARLRRNTVIDRMSENGFITVQQRDSLKQLEDPLDYNPIDHNTGTGTYFREMLRLTMTAERPKRSSYANDWDYQQAAKMWDENPIYGWTHKNRKADGTEYHLYKDGLKIYTTINASMQKYAEEALFEHLKTTLQPQMNQQIKSDNRIFRNVTAEQIETIKVQAMKNSDWYRELKKTGASDADIRRVFDQEKMQMRIFTYNGEIDTLMTPMDSILHYKSLLRASFMAMDPLTGYVKAYVGGPDFRYFKYDMVKQGKRQVGSTIKPFIYTFAIDHLGFSPCHPVFNAPVTLETFNQEPWTPKEAGGYNYDYEYHPLQWGLQQSRNNYSAWIMKQAKQAQPVADYIHKLGIRSYIDPVPALCLGSADVSLFEMVGAYATYANQGVHTEPLFVTRIEDRQGNLLSTFTPQSTDAISAQTAFTMLNMLKNVVTHGTAARINWMYHLKGPEDGDIGGKTGTSQYNSDGWFIGVTPKLVAGGWVGAEDR
ncbi:MAG: transglycosylase domain-containing protein, partial [Rikenellaceae bacterium]|nr:transglycosylase domain-containing protein [Rikenellaceae bacterium]